MIARGAGCAHPAVTLGASASSFFPVSPTARANLLRAHHRAKPRVRLRSLGASARRHGLVIAVSTTTGVLRHLTIELKRGRRIRATVRVARLGRRTRRLVLRVHGHIPARGRYTIVVGDRSPDRTAPDRHRSLIRARRAGRPGPSLQIVSCPSA